MRRADTLLAGACALLLAAGCGDSGPPPVQPTERALTGAWPGPVAGGDEKAAKDPVGPVSKNLFARNYYVVLDASGSMKDSGCSGKQPKIEVAKRALVSFAESLPADANLGLLAFDDGGIREWLPLGVQNRDRFRAALNSVRAGADTPLRESINRADAQLSAQGARQFGYGEYYLVVVTDGEASAGQNPEPVVNDILRHSPVVLHTIGFCIGTNHSLNQPGRTFYRAADNPEQLRQGLGEVLAEAPAFNTAKFK